VCLAEKVPVISFFWREPGALVRRAKYQEDSLLKEKGNAEQQQMQQQKISTL
jgi:hypothetical protein